MFCVFFFRVNIQRLPSGDSRPGRLMKRRGGSVAFLDEYSLFLISLAPLCCNRAPDGAVAAGLLIKYLFFVVQLSLAQLPPQSPKKSINLSFQEEDLPFRHFPLPLPTPPSPRARERSLPVVPTSQSFSAPCQTVTPYTPRDGLLPRCQNRRDSSLLSPLLCKRQLRHSLSNSPFFGFSRLGLTLILLTSLKRSSFPPSQGATSMTLRPRSRQSIRFLFIVSS